MAAGYGIESSSIQLSAKSKLVMFFHTSLLDKELTQGVKDMDSISPHQDEGWSDHSHFTPKGLDFLKMYN